MSVFIWLYADTMTHEASNPMSPPRAEESMHGSFPPDVELQEEQEAEEKSVMPVIKKKYLLVLILLWLTMFLLPEYVDRSFLPTSYLVLGLLFLCTYWLREERRFRKINKKLRPFVMTKHLEYIAYAYGVGLLIETVPAVVWNAELLVPYVFLRIVYGAAVYQYVSIFQAAHRAKEENPLRCEFC